MAFRKMPPSDVLPLTPGGRWTPDYFDFLKGLDGLDELSKIVFPAPTTIDGVGPAAFTLGYPLSRSTLALSAPLTRLTASLGADVSLNNTANYFDGPSVVQGATGTWFVSGSVTLTDTSVGNGAFSCKLWDGTTVIASGRFVQASQSNLMSVMALSGIITSPAGNLRISCKDTFSTSGAIVFNASGNSKDSTITAVRIA